MEIKDVEKKLSFQNVSPRADTTILSSVVKKLSSKAYKI